MLEIHVNIVQQNSWDFNRGNINIWKKWNIFSGIGSIQFSSHQDKYFQYYLRLCSVPSFTSLLCNLIIILVFHTFIDFHIFIEFACLDCQDLYGDSLQSVIGGFKEISYVEEGNGSIYIDTVKRVYPDQFSTLVIRYNHHHLITKIVISLTSLNVQRAWHF